MIDTVRFRGPADKINFDWDYSHFTGIRHSSGKEYFHQISVEKNENYRAFYFPATNTMDIEFNMHKILFKDNVYNYSQNPAILGNILRSFASCFYSSLSYVYVTRCDIGGVITYENQLETVRTLESFRRCRLPGSRVNKFRHQNYADSVFYYTTNWSFKIYNKGAEMGDNAKEFKEFDLMNTLRFEKTFRFREMKRLGMQITSGKGVEISEFNVSLLLDDFFQLLENWEFSQTPHVTDKVGTMGTLAILEQAGLFSEVEAMKTVSRSTLWRYKKLKKENVQQKKYNLFQIYPTTYCASYTIVIPLGSES